GCWLRRPARGCWPERLAHGRADLALLRRALERQRRHAYLGYVVSKDTVPPVLRVSDEDRDHVIEILRHGSEDGRLSNETFVHRMEIALQARGPAELAALLRDLPAPAQDHNWLVRTAGWFARLGRRIRRSWRTSR